MCRAAVFCFSEGLRLTQAGENGAVWRTGLATEKAPTAGDDRPYASKTWVKERDRVKKR